MLFVDFLLFIFANRILHIAYHVVCCPLGLIELAFSLQFLVTGDLASGV